MSEEKQLEDGEIDECSEDDYPVKVVDISAGDVMVDLHAETKNCQAKELVINAISTPKEVSEQQIEKECIILDPTTENGNNISASGDSVVVSAENMMTTEKSSGQDDIVVVQEQQENKNDKFDSTPRGGNTKLETTTPDVNSNVNESESVILKKNCTSDSSVKDRSVLSEIDDISDLLCRQELIQQLVNKTDLCANVSEGKARGKKRKSKSLSNKKIIDKPSLPLLLPLIDTDIDDELFALRRDGKKRPKKTKKKKNLANVNGKKRPSEYPTSKLSKIPAKKSSNKEEMKCKSPQNEVVEYGIGIPNVRHTSPSAEPFRPKKKSDKNKDDVKDRNKDNAKDKKDTDKNKDNKDKNKDHVKDKNKDGKDKNKHKGLHNSIYNRTFSKSTTKQQRRTSMRARKRVQVNQVGKETKSKSYLPYSAQQEREVKILQKQQEEMAFDNYSNIPMEIEDDDALASSSDNVAPLPLIETVEVRPPPPPGEDFQPVHDQTSLSMTRSNVAWMPGFVETLDPDLETPSPSPRIETIEVESPKVGKEESISDVAKTEETNEKKEDEEDVWALRAQALKSLACKRAVRAKELHRNKKKSQELAEVTKADKEVEDIISPKEIDESRKVENVVSPKAKLSAITTIPSSKTTTLKCKSKKALYERKPPPPPPQHPPVIIQLRQEDFNSESDDEVPCSSTQNVKSKIMSRRRKKYVHDDTLLKDLQSNIKRCRLRMKKNSSSIVRDQLTYKKLQNEITKQRNLYQEQKENVKRLQDALQLAIKQKASTCKTHNKLHENIKIIKDQLKEKIQVRNATDEKILRAKSIISVNRLQGSTKGSIRNPLKEQLLKLMESLRESYQGLLNAEKSHDTMPMDDLITSKYSSKNLENGMETNSYKVPNKSNETVEKIDLTLENNEVKTGHTLQSDGGKIRGVSNVKNIEVVPLTKEKPEIKKLECEDPAKNLICSEAVISNLAELKKAYNNTSRPCDTSCITYSLLELLQGLGDAESVKVIEIQPPIPSNTQTSEVPSNISDKKCFEKYKTPLSRFKSYRLSPKFASGSMLSIRSATFSNEIQPHMTICHYDLLGTCNDSSCAHTHLDEKCVTSTHGLVNDLLAYQLNDIDGCESLDSAERQRHLNLYTNQFMKKYGEKLSLDNSTPFLWNHLKEFCRSKKRELSDTVILNNRNWFYQNKYEMNSPTEECAVEHYSSHFDVVYFLNKKSKTGSGFPNENQEIRYFSKRYNSVELLKERLGENPSDVKLWISLVRRILSNDKSNNSFGKQGFKKISPNVREYALSVLSQGLEENAYSEELWTQYLKLFSMNYETEELRELCYHAVMYAANYNVWWTCLTLEMTMTGKQEICTEMVKFIRGGQDDVKNKSHYLTETILYVTQLLTCCEKLEDGKDYLRNALSINICNNNKSENNSMIGICEHLSREDKSLLWVCLISLQMFKNLPQHIFSIEESGPGRLVNKVNFLLDWQSGSWSSSEEDARSLFKAGLHITGNRSVTVLRELMLLYENFLAFELSLGNIEPAVNILRGLVTEFPSFVDGWRLLLLLYIQFFPTEDVISVGEEAVSKCGANPMIIYFFSKFLLKRKLGNLALQNLAKCIRSCVKMDNVDDDGDETSCSSIAQRYKKIIKLSVSSSSSSETAPKLLNINESSFVYHCLCYCLLNDSNIDNLNNLSSAASEKKALDAFEYVIHLYNSPKTTKMLWLACMEYKANYLSTVTVISHQEYQSFIDLLFQCLASVSAIGVVKENPNVCWRDYKFHNKVIDMALAIIPVDKHSILYQKLINFMPDNIALALRICDHEFERNNYDQAQVIYSSMISEFPNCLQLWNTAVKIESKCGNVKEIRWLLNEATNSLPFCSFLWRELVKFEILHSTNFDSVKVKLKEIANKAVLYGIDINKFLPKLK